MEYAKLERDTLAHIDDSYYLGAHCRKCGHHARLNIPELKAHLGNGFRLVDIRERLRCQRCGDRKLVVLRLLDPSQRTGNLVPMFEGETEGGKTREFGAVLHRG